MPLCQLWNERYRVTASRLYNPKQAKLTLRSSFRSASRHSGWHGCTINRSVTVGFYVRVFNQGAAFTLTLPASDSSAQTHTSEITV
jgi:hypothetical protein